MFVWTQVKHKIITFMSATEFKNILETKTHNEKEKKKASYSIKDEQKHKQKTKKEEKANNPWQRLSALLYKLCTHNQDSSRKTHNIKNEPTTIS